MAKLSDAKLRALKATGKAQKAFDGEGLYIFVSPKGSKVWRIDYRFEGKYKTLTVGKYPSISLVEARKKLAEVKEKLAHELDPQEEKKALAQAEKDARENTFEQVARIWLEEQGKGMGGKKPWTPHTHTTNRTRLESNVFPLVGYKPIATITKDDILGAVKRIESRGAVEVSHRVLTLCSQVFRYAKGESLCQHDPTENLRSKLSSPKKVSFATIKKPKEVGELLRAIDGYTGNIIVRTALQIAPYVFVRPSELRCAPWTEFDLDEGLWRIEAERMKMREPHIVPLATQVIELLRELHEFTGHTQLLFPSMRTKNRPISDMTLLAGLRRIGYAQGEMTVHGFRSMASTLLNEQGYNRDWIERQLAHSERNGVRAAYNYAEYLPQRKQMMQEWASYLDRLRKQV